MIQENKILRWLPLPIGLTVLGGAIGCLVVVNSPSWKATQNCTANFKISEPTMSQEYADWVCRKP